MLLTPSSSTPATIKMSSNARLLMKSAISRSSLHFFRRGSSPVQPKEDEFNSNLDSSCQRDDEVVRVLPDFSRARYLSHKRHIGQSGRTSLRPHSPLVAGESHRPPSGMETSTQRFLRGSWCALETRGEQRSGVSLLHPFDMGQRRMTNDLNASAEPDESVEELESKTSSELKDTQSLPTCQTEPGSESDQEFRRFSPEQVERIISLSRSRAISYTTDTLSKAKVSSEKRSLQFDLPMHYPTTIRDEKVDGHDVIAYGKRTGLEEPAQGLHSTAPSDTVTAVRKAHSIECNPKDRLVMALT